MAADREESKNNQVEDRHSGDTWVIKWTIYNKLSGPIAEKDVKKVKMIQILLFVCFLSTWAYDESREQTSDRPLY